MSESEKFLSRWSRLKREADAEPGSEAKPEAAAPPDDAAAVSAPAAEEPEFDLASLPSLDSIAADTDISMFMKAGVPAELRHAALRRAWASDPAIRDFRGLQENDWDFTAPERVPGFGVFKSESEIRELAQRLVSGGSASEPVSQPAPQDSRDAPVETAHSDSDRALDKAQPTRPLASGADAASASGTAMQQDHDTAVQHATARRHGGALPQ